MNLLKYDFFFDQSDLAFDVHLSSDLPLLQMQKALNLLLSFQNEEQHPYHGNKVQSSLYLYQVQMLLQLVLLLVLDKK